MTWTSSQPNVATISTAGVATGRNAGTTRIVATTPAGARDTAVLTSIGNGPLVTNGPTGTFVTILVDLTKCEYTIQAFYYLDITVSPNGPSGAYPIAWLQTPSAGLGTIGQMAQIPAIGTAAGLTGDLFVPYGLSAHIFANQSTAGEANVTFVTHAVP